MNSRLPFIIYWQIENYISNPCDLPVWCSGNGLFAGFGISLAPAKLLVYNYFGTGQMEALKYCLLLLLLLLLLLSLLLLSLSLLSLSLLSLSLLSLAFYIYL
jgi:hypothetical protein